MSTPIKRSCSHPTQKSNPAISFGGLLQKLPLALAVLVAATLLAPTTQAQTIRFRSGMRGATVPLGFLGSNVLTNSATVNGAITPVVLSVSGLPPGATADLSANNFTASTAVNLTLNTTNVANGLYTLSLDATGGATNHWLFNLQVGDVWNGNATVSNNFAAASSWVGGVAPGSSDDVLFTQIGAATAATVTNITVDANTTVASLRFSQTNSSNYFHTMQINPGVTLSLGGNNGFSMLRDYLDELQGISSRMTVTILGPNGTLSVANENANIGVLLDGQINLCTLNMSGLGTFKTDVSQIGLGEYQLYPNFRNYATDNGYPNGGPRRFCATVFLAMTNNIKAVYADPFNYTNEYSRGYGLSFINSEVAGTGSSPANNLNLGISNAFFVDSVCFIRANHQGFVQFNSAFNSMNPVAYFRGTNGGRMSVFTTADDGTTNAASSNVKATVNFGAGTVDILADKLYMSRDRTIISSNQTPNVQSDMIVGKGIIDVNTAILGYQEHDSKTNWTVISGGTAQAYLNYCQGRLFLTNNATFRVNDKLILGYTADTNRDTAGGYTAAQQYNTRGQVTLANGSTLMANTIQIDGGLNLSSQNTITLTNNSSLILSNTLGSATKRMDTLNMFNGSSLTLFVDAAATSPLVYVTNLVLVGSNALVVAQINNLDAVAVPVITYVNPPSSVLTPVLPAGIVGALIDDGIGTIFLQILTNTPKSIVWRGYASADWNQTDLNWLDLSTGMHTNFVSGDSVAFDDATSVTNVSVTEANMIVSGFNVTNSANQYTFGSSGNVIGATPMNKWGTGKLQIDTKIAASIQLNQGLLTGSGTIGAVTVAAGATMDFAGSLTSLACSGTATLEATASGFGLLSVPGICTNLGSFSGQFSVLSGGALYNSGGLHNIGASAVNGTLINGGTIGDDGVVGNLTINTNAVFEDLGTGSLTLDTLSVNAGGTFIPGGDGIGTTTILTTHNSGNVGLVRLLTGSINIFKVNLTNAQPYTMLRSTRIVFGPSQSAKSQNGCTLAITNVGPTPFSVGSLQLFGSSTIGAAIGNAGLNTTNAYPIITPPTPNYPTLGLAWDPITDLYPKAATPLGGFIDITGVATGSTNLNFSTTIVGKTNIVASLQWPQDHTGWRLQTQTDPLTVGLTTNWTDVFGSTLTNQMVFTNSITTNCVFYRLVYP